MNIIKLALFDLRYSLLSVKGWLLIVPFGLFWLSLFYLMQEGGIDFITKEYGLAASTIVLKPDTVMYLFKENPAVLSMCLLTALNTTPLFVLLAANNQTAVDAGNGSFRYLLPRATRTQIFFARMLSAYMLLCLANIIVVSYGIFLSTQIDHFTVLDTFSYGLSVLFHILLYTLPFVAIMAVLSAIASSALASMLYAIVLLFLFSILIGWYQTDIPILQYLLPTHFKQELYYVANSELWHTYSILFIYGLVLTIIAWWLFQRRDL